MPALSPERRAELADSDRMADRREALEDRVAGLMVARYPLEQIRARLELMIDCGPAFEEWLAEFDGDPSAWDYAEGVIEELTLSQMIGEFGSAIFG